MALLGLLLLLIGWSAFDIARGTARPAVEFDVFRIAGAMALEGRAAEAYDVAVMREAQFRHAGTTAVMPWSYPPPFSLLTMPLALLPASLGYLLFIGGSFAAWLLVLRRIAGPEVWTVLFAVFPAAIVNIRSGQNGFLTAALLGIALLGWMGGGSRGGVALGLLVIKPHLAAGAGLLALVDWRWRRLLACGLTVLALSVASVLAFGPGVLAGFRDGAAETSRLLLLGAYPLFRMTSVFAAALQAGIPSGSALALQAAGALAGVLAILAAAVWLRRRRAAGTLPDGAARRVAGLAAFGTLLVSPYCYDYDLTILGLAAGFLWPCLARRAGRAALWGLLALCWLASGSGVLLVTLSEVVLRRPALVAEGALPSLGAIAMLALAAVAAALLRRPPGPLSLSRRSPQRA